MVGGALEEHRKPSEQRCAYACRCPEGVAAPLGCVIFFISDEIVACMTCSRNFFRFSRRSSLCCSCASCVSARSFSVLVFARKTTGDYFSRTPISARSWSRVLSKNAESLRNSDALMRVAVPRRRGPAGLRDLFLLLSELWLTHHVFSAFRACERGGGIITLGVFRVLLKRWTSACQKGSFVVF